MTRKDISIGEIVGKKLLEKGLTLSTAESCTGGNIAHLLTIVPGSSRYFKGTIVSYANEVKINLLGVSPQTLDKVGAVSEEVVIEMAKGALKQLHTDCTIAVSGIAGPDGGTEDKPVGTVWVCTACNGVFQTRRYQFGQDRESNITCASNFALQQLLDMLM